MIVLAARNSGGAHNEATSTEYQQFIVFTHGTPRHLHCLWEAKGGPALVLKVVGAISIPIKHLSTSHGVSPASDGCSAPVVEGVFQAPISAT
jgi:hypothetical protein